MSNFDFDNIPDYVLHEAVHKILGSQDLVKIPDGYNFRCIICGDSQTNKHKKRGFVLTNNNKWTYMCHNECGSMSFLKVIEKFDIELYKKILFSAFKKEPKPKKIEIQETFKGSSKYQFKKGELVSIYDKHPIAVKGFEYCKTRKIRKEVYSKWFVCIRDKKFLDKDENGKFKVNERGQYTGNEYGNRLIIPYYVFGGTWIQFDARTLDDSIPKYRNLSNTDRELYNIDWLDVNKPFYLLEGSINSTFIKNSIAFGGTKHLKAFIEKYPQLVKNAHNGCIIWDNDAAGYNELKYGVSLGFSWFNWSTIKVSDEFKFKPNGDVRTINDINDLVLYVKEVEMDKDGFVESNFLGKYIEKPEGSDIKITILYGNRDKIKREKFNKTMQKLKNNKSQNIYF